MCRSPEIGSILTYRRRFNLILDEALKSVITDALWDNDTISDVTIGTDGFTVTFFEN